MTKDREVWLSALTWVGFLSIAGGVWRVELAAVGLVALIVAWIIPSAEHRNGRATLLDQHAPQFQFSEVHRLFIAAPKGKVYEAMKEVTAGEIQFFGLLTALRRGGKGGPESVVNVPSDQPILKVALRTGFRILAEMEERELVFATTVIAPDSVASMNFLLEDTGRDGTLLTTETRVYAPRPKARRRFAIYWRTILPGSALIRYYWLRAIAKRAVNQR